MMKLVRMVWRFFHLLAHVLAGMVGTAVYSWVLRISHDTPRYQRLIRWWLGGIVRILGGRVSVYGTPANRGVMMVCNHISWLDIPLLGGESSIRFLSKQEVKAWPVIGWLATQAGTLYIERGRRGAAQEAADSISDSLRNGEVVMVFPEGTTSDGAEVLPFHARLFASVIDADAAVQPVAIRYRDASGVLSELVPYLDDVSLWHNLLGILAQAHMDIEVHYLPPFKVAGQSRKALATLSETQISQTLSS
uniref:1-acyl-sn-glycerol-3-phosphate acyltransferase (EC) n=1 Tax=uncultured Thiotrichaceae bacterium TaxID=298394 RepID=A0A6S6UHI7_9GAMM|nr:MAG: 1-acyl-sn-glycerol-3-phosphate acyltransferase (EC [uncultured Thiotrichaceae bacterium]